MTVEGTSQRKLTELVADHVFIDVHRNMLTAVVNGDRQTDELRKNGGATRPGLDRTLVATGLSGFNLLSLTNETFTGPLICRNGAG